jgi:hypothetical protein
MNRNIKITFTFLVISGLLVVMGFIISRNLIPASEQNPPTKLPTEVDWSRAIEILNSGQVAQVVQSHNLEVILTLKDGSQLKTIEPIIDDIIKAAELCGEVCAEVLLITE